MNLDKFICFQTGLFVFQSINSSFIFKWTSAVHLSLNEPKWTCTVHLSWNEPLVVHLFLNELMELMTTHSGGLSLYFNKYTCEIFGHLKLLRLCLFTVLPRVAGGFHVKSTPFHLASAHAQPRKNDIFLLYKGSFQLKWTSILNY